MSPAIPILGAVALIALFAGSGEAAPAAPVEPDEAPPPGPGPKGGTTPIGTPPGGDEGPPGGENGSAIRERAIRDECEGKARFAIDSGDPGVMIQVADEIQGDCPDLAQVLREAADEADPWGWY